jgi:bla regulator protein BlaR1
MSSLLHWNEQWTAALVNHLWQSTIVTALALLLTLALKNNQARVRYWVWLAASAKFLLPFSLLMDAGQWARLLIAAPIAKPSVAAAIDQFAQPYQGSITFGAASTALPAHSVGWVPTILLAVWLCGVVLIAARWARSWMRIRAVVREAVPAEIAGVPVAAGVPVLCSATLLEPGVFGILRPVLLLPKGILDRLKPAQLRAIVAHEMCHVRRRDNLTFALHMIVQAVFWFHPLTWWIGTRLIEERERACDEAVLEAGGEAEVYAEGILSVCKFYVESPLACAAGVSGADLKHRITRIMTAPMTRQLNLTRKLLLGAAGFAAVAFPLSLGLMRSVLAEDRAEDAAARLPKFEVASIKPHPSDDRISSMRLLPDGIATAGLPLKMLIRFAFGISDDRIFNEPSWVESERFDVNTKVDPADASKMKGLPIDQRWSMMLPVLVDRFGMKFHRETREVEVYTLVLAKGGSKMSTVQGDAPNEKEGLGRTMVRFSPDDMSLVAHGGTMDSLAHMISQQLGSTVLDKTGLEGKYEVNLHWTPERATGLMSPPAATGPSGGGEPAPASEGLSLFTALQEQLGLRLVSQKEPVEVVVIDHIQQPSPN